MSQKRAEAIVIGASAGALEALRAVLPALPADYPLPAMIVVHLPPDRDSLMTELLQSDCSLPIREAQDKEPIKSGTIYFAPPDYHLLVEPDKRLSLSSEEPVHHSRPSIDVLFESAADVFGPGLIGVILTGGNDDGAAGLQSIERAGGIAIVQRPEQAHAQAMPGAALKACPAARQVSLDELATYLLEVIDPP